MTRVPNLKCVGGMYSQLSKDVLWENNPGKSYKKKLQGLQQTHWL